MSSDDTFGFYDDNATDYAVMPSSRLEGLAANAGLVVEMMERSEGFGYSSTRDRLPARPYR